MQKQPAQRGRTTEEQLRRFMGTRGGRKIHYATLLVDALDVTEVPRPLDRVLAHCGRSRRATLSSPISPVGSNPAFGNRS
jgi:hypothetical protein